MLSDKAIQGFRRAVDVVSGGDGEVDGVIVKAERVGQTAETVADFEDAWGEPEVEETPFGEVNFWEGIRRAKGLRRGDLYVMDCGEFRAIYFTGEVGR